MDVRCASVMVVSWLMSKIRIYRQSFTQYPFGKDSSNHTSTCSPASRKRQNYCDPGLGNAIVAHNCLARRL